MIGWVGLGQMGKPMALNLTRDAGRFIVSNRRAERLREFEERGVAVTTQPRDVAGSEIIFLSLPDTEAVQSVLFGEQGISTYLKAGTIIVDTSTISYGATIDISGRLGTLGVAFIDAPVSGMKARAEDGTLTVMCGGPHEMFQTVRPLLTRIGSSILYMGPAGSGQLTKLVNQLLFDVNVAALAEILPMAAKMGLDPEKVGAAVNGGTGRSYASEFFVPRILDGGFSAGYPMKYAYKDLASAAELAANRGIPLPVVAAATATYQQALLRGLGDLDKGAMIRVFEDLLGVAFRKTSCGTTKPPEIRA